MGTTASTRTGSATRTNFFSSDERGDRPLTRMPSALRQRNSKLVATPCFFATRATGFVLLSSMIARFSSSLQRRRASATKTLVICPDIGTVPVTYAAPTATLPDHPQVSCTPCKAARAGRLRPRIGREDAHRNRRLSERSRHPLPRRQAMASVERAEDCQEVG